MALIKTPPAIHWEMPTLVPGVETRGRIRLVCSAPITIDGIDVKFRCTVSAVIRSIAIRDRKIVHVAVLRGRRELGTGAHDFDLSLRVPETSPPACGVGSFRVSWVATVRVSIPWWIDAVRRIPVFVAPMPMPEPEPRPAVFRADPPWPDFRVQLDSDVVQAGGVLRGRFVLADAGVHHYQSAMVTLRCELEGQHWGGAETGTTLDETKVVTSRVVSLAPERVVDDGVPFELPIPLYVFPAIRLDKLRVRWLASFQVRASSMWRPELTAPLTVRAGRGAGSSSAPAVEGSLLGDPRLRREWARAGLASGFDNADDVLFKRLAGGDMVVSLRPGIIYHDIEAELRMWPIDVGFRVEGGRLRCREPSQERALDQALLRHAGRVRFRSAGDGYLRVTADTAYSSWQPLERHLEAVEALFNAVLDVRLRMPIPDSVAHVAPVFEDAARRLGGELVVAGLDIFGARDEMPFSLETRWDRDGSLLCTALTVRPLLAVAARYHGHWGPDGFPDELPAGLAPLLDGAFGLAVGPHAIELYLAPAPTSADEVVDRLEALIAVGLRLSMRGGLYR